MKIQIIFINDTLTDLCKLTSCNPGSLNIKINIMLTQHGILIAIQYR